MTREPIVFSCNKCIEHSINDLNLQVLIIFTVISSPISHVLPSTSMLHELSIIYCALGVSKMRERNP